jgi:hypothetical protein
LRQTELLAALLVVDRSLKLHLNYPFNTPCYLLLLMAVTEKSTFPRRHIGSVSSPSDGGVRRERRGLAKSPAKLGS